MQQQVIIIDFQSEKERERAVRCELGPKTPRSVEVHGFCRWKVKRSFVFRALDRSHNGFWHSMGKKKRNKNHRQPNIESNILSESRMTFAFCSKGCFGCLARACARLPSIFNDFASTQPKLWLLSTCLVFVLFFCCLSSLTLVGNNKRSRRLPCKRRTCFCLSRGRRRRRHRRRRPCTLSECQTMAQLLTRGQTNHAGMNQSCVVVWRRGHKQNKTEKMINMEKASENESQEA